MSRSGVSAALAAFVVLTVVLGGSTAYLLANPTGPAKTTTSTVFQTSTTTAPGSSYFSTATATVTTVSIPTSGSPAYTVGIAYKQGIGFYLVDSTGMTLYFRTADNQTSGTSGCTAQCVNIWPVFDAQNLVLPPGLSGGSFRSVVRADGLTQLEYNNWPLYHFSGDVSPGDTKGEGIGGIWFAYTLPAPSQVSSTTSVTSSLTSTTAATSTPSATSTTTASSTAPTATSTTTHTTTSTTYYTYSYTY